VKANTETKWCKKLEAVDIIPSDVSDDLQKVFRSGIYCMMISPQVIPAVELFGALF